MKFLNFQIHFFFYFSIFGFPSKTFFFNFPLIYFCSFENNSKFVAQMSPKLWTCFGRGYVPFQEWKVETTFPALAFHVVLGAIQIEEKVIFSSSVCYFFGFFTKPNIKMPVRRQTFSPDASSNKTNYLSNQNGGMFAGETRPTSKSMPSRINMPYDNDNEPLFIQQNKQSNLTEGGSLTDTNLKKNTNVQNSKRTCFLLYFVFKLFDGDRSLYWWIVF